MSDKDLMTEHNFTEKIAALEDALQAELEAIEANIQNGRELKRVWRQEDWQRTQEQFKRQGAIRHAA